jgi:hypothetical protein
MIDHRRKSSIAVGPGRGRRDVSTRVTDAVIALATCHNVCPSQSRGDRHLQPGNTGDE